MSILNTTSVACVSLCNDPLGARDTKEKDYDIINVESFGYTYLCWFSPIFGDLFLSFSNLFLSLARHYYFYFKHSYTHSYFKLITYTFNDTVDGVLVFHFSQKRSTQ